MLPIIYYLKEIHLKTVLCAAEIDFELEQMCELSEGTMASLQITLFEDGYLLRLRGNSVHLPSTSERSEHVLDR